MTLRLSKLPSSFLNCSLTTDVTTYYSCTRYLNVGNEFQFTIMKKKYSNLFENSSDFGNNMGRLFFWNTRCIRKIENKKKNKEIKNKIRRRRKGNCVVCPLLSEKIAHPNFHGGFFCLIPCFTYLFLPPV